MVSYRSTRGDVTGATFEEVVLGGLAPDRGLYVPETIPTFTPQQVPLYKMWQDDWRQCVLSHPCPNKSLSP